MMKKDGTPTKAELRIIERVKEHGGYFILTKDEFGNHYTTQDGRKVASEEETVERMIKDGLFKPRENDGLFDGMSQTFIPA